MRRRSGGKASFGGFSKREANDPNPAMILCGSVLRRSARHLQLQSTVAWRFETSRKQPRVSETSASCLNLGPPKKKTEFCSIIDQILHLRPHWKAVFHRNARPKRFMPLAGRLPLNVFWILNGPQPFARAKYAAGNKTPRLAY
jgi:hypothetical protein